MWVFDEHVDLPNDETLRDQKGDNPVKLTHAINTVHQNIKHLPGIKLPINLIANPDLQDAVKGASILVFKLLHQFISKTLDQNDQ
ncbi:hypothetical protein N7489_005061 [Penicillium chrysogenum]|uniref:Glycerol-3-phosphate dehydrogenase NAD-dependent N-terminal domain-containing protein n=1 Tax=Penicillium chrysogenum TaxID=5076 RepID=A0ABQ8WEE2_PENCH|nr:uncharacterized protein N7489_005061 [Penicillium chrysogenum]KAJ5244965.1 hypothetical protein N7489_005061 [Penicillium chrysogenum]KAJ5264760.1 hypothetical protein N7505_007553 [Penicillium chrysogenum]KAJ5849189.1 hypothetical protein N7534_007878 [Penicillium rubens]